MVTIKDIAKKANVSVTTVSMVMNNKGSFPQETRDKVLKIANSLNYKPNRAAQSLKTKKSHIIAIIVGDISNPYFIDIIKGFEKKAREYDYEIILSDCGRDYNRSLAQLKTLESRGVDGIFFSWAGVLNEELSKQLTEIKKEGIPIIMSENTFFKDLNIPFVDFDIEKSINKSLTYLMELNHQRIGYIGGSPNYGISDINLKYYKKFMKENGIYNSENIEYGYYEIEGGKKAAKKMLIKKNRPTAIQATTDLMAIGALLAAKELEIKVPDELSIMGFDNINYSKYTDPPISTIEMYKNEIGFYAAENLIKKIENKSYEIPPEHLISTELIIRDSCTKKRN